MRFPHTATVQRLQETGGKFEYSNVSTVKAFLQPVSQEDAELFSLTFTKGSVVFLPINSGVKEKDRLVINGATYGIKGIISRAYGSRLNHDKAGVERL